MAFDGSGNGGGDWVVVPNSLLSDQWIEVRIATFYSLSGAPDHTWRIKVFDDTGILVGTLSDLGFKDNDVDRTGSLHFDNGADNGHYLDEITIQETTNPSW